MTIIPWRDDFKTGIASVDYEHEQLIAAINKMHDDYAKDPTEDNAMNLLADIQSMVQGHFALEERIMREKNVDRYKEHKLDHDRLLDGLRDIMDEIGEEGVDFNELVRTQVSKWFEDHFTTLDKDLHAVIGDHHH